jgi:hypothetical protein
MTFVRGLLSGSLFIPCLLTGCSGKDNQPNGDASESKHPSQMPVTHKADLFGYFLEIETMGSYSISQRVDNRASGTETVVQLAEYEWGGNKLKIDKGMLTFNGKERGKLEQGDRVRVDKEGQLSVNGKERP